MRGRSPGHQVCGEEPGRAQASRHTAEAFNPASASRTSATANKTGAIKHPVELNALSKRRCRRSSPQTPQFVLLSHDDAISVAANAAVRGVVNQFKNPGGCAEATGSAGFGEWAAASTHQQPPTESTLSLAAVTPAGAMCPSPGSYQAAPAPVAELRSACWLTTTSWPPTRFPTPLCCLHR